MAHTARISITAPIIKQLSTIHHIPVVLGSKGLLAMNMKANTYDNAPEINKIQEEIVAKALNMFGILHLLLLTY